MLRKIHSLPGLVAALFVAVLAITGAILSVEPVLETIAAPKAKTGEMSVAAMADFAKQRHGEIDKIVRTASGTIIVSYFDGDKAGASVFDPASGQVLAPHTPSGFTRIVTNLHRSLLAGDAGRVAAGLGALAMVLLTISGAMLLAARLGGWKAILRPIRGTTAQRWHVELGRIAMTGLLLSALTGCFMSLATFEVIPDGSAQKLATPENVNGGDRLPVGELPALKGIDLTDLRELAFPYASDLSDTYRLTTAHGVSHIDAATGGVLAFQAHSTAREVYELIYMLHTGQGIWPLALLLGFCALMVPVLSVTGAMIWWKRRSGFVRIADNTGAQSADTIILVGSEGNSTWGFARTLHAALTLAGHRVHAAPMNALVPAYAKAARMLILTATYGDGAAPASANVFLSRLCLIKTGIPVAVLGFGDLSFPHFCRFADDVTTALSAKGWPILLDTQRIDRQSSQEFARWGEALGAVTGCNLQLAHVAQVPKTGMLTLARRVDYGAEVQAPTAILTFEAAQPEAGTDLWRQLFPRRLPAFEAGDIVGVLPPGSNVPRYYSLASASKDGILEICVRKQPGGLCSTYLHSLAAGGTIEAFIRPNPGFRPNRSKAPLVLIGAGAGIGPLMGFIRQSSGKRPVHLYWGGRSPSSDFLYENELGMHLINQRLSTLNTIFSRITGGGYVQDRIGADSAELLSMIRQGAQILVCGGRDMAAGVANALEAILHPAGLTLASLRLDGRYVEDVY